MILLVGNNHDDVLYIETRMTDKKEEYVYKKYKVVIGNIASQTVVLLENVYTNIISSTLVSYIIEKYYILFVIKIGKCLTASKTIKNGDITISKKVIASDVDVTDLQGTKLGQIPGFDLSFDPSYELINSTLNSFTKFSFATIHECTVVSSNVHHHTMEKLEELLHDGKILTEEINNVVFDSEAYGVGVACSMHDIPFITINVVLNHIGEKFAVNNYVRVLKQYNIVGKAVSNLISELGSNEVLRD